MEWYNSAITYLLIFCYALSFGIFAHVFPNGIYQFHDGILQNQHFQLQTKVENCDSLIIFDLSNQVTKENIFNISIKTFLQFILDNCKTFKYISIDSNFNGCENSNLCNVTTTECNTVNGCDIKNLDYNAILSSYSADLVHDDITTINNYFTFFYKILSQIIQCESNSVLLLTNRIVPMKNNSIINQPAENLFKTFTPIILGRNDANATGILQNAYENIKVAKILNLPNYDCLNYLFYCLLSCSNNNCPECLKTDIDDCQEPSTFMPNDKLNETLHIWCIFAVANKTIFGQSEVYSVVNQLQNGITAFTEKTSITQYRIKVFFDENGYFTEDVKNLTVPTGTFPYIDISTDENNATIDNNQFNHILSLIPWSSTLTERRPGKWFIFIATNYGTDDFKPWSKDSHLWGQINIYKDSEAYNTYLQKLQNDTYIQLTYQSIESAKINIIPLNYPSDYNKTITTTTSIKSSTISTSTELSTTSEFYFVAPHKKSKTLLICGLIAGGFIIITIVFAFIFYRTKKGREIFERMQICHGRRKSIRRNHRGKTSSIGDSWELTWDRLQIKNDELSTGASEQLLHGVLLSDFRNEAHQSSTEVAIKMPNKNALQIDRDKFLNEINIMKKISGHHDNIIKILGSITKDPQICLVMEFCSNLDLFNYVKAIKYNDNQFEEYKKQKKKEFFIFAWQILHGMQYLSSNLIIHRNITAKNVLIDSVKSAKITDFGLAVYATEKIQPLTSFDEEKFPTKWLAIEVWKNWEFSFQSDIWAFGVTLYEMYSFGEIPYANVHEAELLAYLEAGNRLEKPAFCSDKIFEIMLKCWSEDSTTRPTTTEIIKNFTELLEQSIEGYGYLELESTISKNN